MILASVTLSILLAGSPGADPVPPPPAGEPPPRASRAIDPDALALVQKMCERVKGAGSFTFRARTSLELPVEGGALATFHNTATVAVRRPDGLAASRSGDLPDFRFAYDGKAMTALDPGKKLWGTAPAPPTLDAMLVAAGETAGISMPFDELLVADPFAAMTSWVTGAARLGVAIVAGKRAEHLVLWGQGLQVELWIDPATALPARGLVVYTDHPARPHFGVEYSDWKLGPKLPPSTFALPRPAGAAEVDFPAAAGAYR